MIYSSLTKLAMRICLQAHEGQTDKGGFPYVLHPFHVAEQMKTEDEIVLALLHDVVEDSDMTISELAELGIPDNILSALQLMTREKGVPYLEYIWKISKNPLAKRVKIADLQHNSDLSRLKEVTEKDKKRKKKYEIAVGILSDISENGLQRIHIVSCDYFGELYLSYYMDGDEIIYIAIEPKKGSKSRIWLSPSHIIKLCEKLATDPISLPLAIFKMVDDKPIEKRNDPVKSVYKEIQDITGCEPQPLMLKCTNNKEKRIFISDYYKNK